jgi:hypothetical protein
VVQILIFLDLAKTISFLDGHYLKYTGFEKIQGVQPKRKI